VCKLCDHFSFFNSDIYVSPPLLWGDIHVLFLSCPSVCLSVTQFVNATPLKLLNRISWNFVDTKDTICSCAYYQEILIAWILWELCPFELGNFPKLTTGWNLVGSEDTICSCAYHQEILISWILWELCPFELRNFPKFTTEAACQRSSSETTEQNFMKLGR
jgi:hypothetical protein